MFFAQQDGGPLIDFTLAPLSEDFGIPLAVMGILVVFTALTMVVAFISVLPRILAPYADKKPEVAVSAPAVDSDQVPEETLVAIAAAVAHYMDKPQRIVRIRGLTPADLGWSLEGRMHHHRSHRIQRRDRG